MKCPVCEIEISSHIIQEYKAKQEVFSLFECHACKTQFWVPFRNPGADWYEERGDYHIQKAIAPKIEREYHKRVLSLSREELRGKKVLDIGCGTGEFLAELRKRGCEVWGVDFDRIAVDVAKSRFSMERIWAMPLEGFFTEVQLPQFDIVFCFEVIEHVDNPLRLLSHIRGVLHPQGRVFMSTPSRERMGARLNVWDYPPNHLTRWSPEAFSNIAIQAGLRVQSIDYVDQFRILLESLQGRFQTGLVKKTSASSPGKSRTFATTGIRFLGIVKAYVFFGIPAFLLWLYGKLIHAKNGTMFIELCLNERA